MSEIHFIGAGGHGRVLFDVVSLAHPDWEVVWHDDAWETLEPIAPVAAVRPVSDLFASAGELTCAVALGDNEVRGTFVRNALTHGHRLPVLIHPLSYVSPHAQLGAGSVVMAGGIVQSGASLGEGVIINTAATVDHDCTVGDAVHIAPGANIAGTVELGSRTFVGAGAAIKPGLRIGSDVVIGAGAVVISPVQDGEVVVGNPAKRLRN